MSRLKCYDIKALMEVKRLAIFIYAWLELDHGTILRKILLGKLYRINALIWKVIPPRFLIDDHLCCHSLNIP